MFYLDIVNEGNSINEAFALKIETFGGKVSKRIDKHVTHVVWSYGKLETLERAIQFSTIKIVSTLWILTSVELMQRQDEDGFKPPDLAIKLQEAHKRKIQTLTKSINRKN